MFRPASLFIGLRYTRAKRRNHFISFISLVSMVGIALGVTVLITVLSVMNGFDREIRSRVFSMVPAMTVTSPTNLIQDWASVQSGLKHYPDVVATAPFVNAQVLINYGASVQPAMVNGILPLEEAKVTELSQKMTQGKLTLLQPGEFGIVLGESLADALGANVGDKVTVVTPQMNFSPAGVMPRFKRFTVVGIFSAGNGFGFDRSMGFVALSDAQKLMAMGSAVNGLHVNISNVYAAPRLAETIMGQFEPEMMVSTWADQFGEFFHAVQLEKTMMFLILLMIVAVAAFNLVSTLVMVVNEKQSDIAILRTYGATPGMIMTIFMVQGGLIGVLGTLLGVLGGLLLAANVTSIVNWIEYVFHVQLISSNVYFVNYLPSHIESPDVIKISAASLILSLIATLYPAWRASTMDPVESLRYE